VFFFLGRVGVCDVKARSQTCCNIIYFSKESLHHWTRWHVHPEAAVDKMETKKAFVENGNLSLVKLNKAETLLREKFKNGLLFSFSDLHRF